MDANVKALLDKAASATEAHHAKEAEMGRVADTIFGMIRHGDGKHQTWLREKSLEVAEALRALSLESVREEAQIQAETLAQLLGAAILRLKELGETSWELPPYARALQHAPARVAEGWSRESMLRQRMRDIFKKYGVGDGTPGWIEHTDQDGKLRRDALSFEGELIFSIEALLEKAPESPAKEQSTIIKKFPGQEVEKFRENHDGWLPSDFAALADELEQMLSSDTSTLSVHLTQEKWKHIIIALHLI